MITDAHKEQAREIIGNVNNYSDEHTGELSISAFGPLAARIASALASRDTEVREVLEGLGKSIGDTWCWCCLHETETVHLFTLPPVSPPGRFGRRCKSADINSTRAREYTSFHTYLV